MILRGRAWTFGENISTDLIIPGRYAHLRGDLAELAKHTLEDIRPEFASTVRPGDIVVGGRNFGIGSPRTCRACTQVAWCECRRRYLHRSHFLPELYQRWLAGHRNGNYRDRGWR
jgi:hypothetical protein